MTYDPRLSHFDLDMKRGAQGELWVEDLRKILAEGSGTVECKTDARYVQTRRFYIEHEQRHRDGVWRPSGIAVTKATLWVLKAGEHALALIIETAWLKRARDLAAKHPSNHKSCDYGDNPTRGIVVTMEHILATRERARDEHAAALSLPG